MAEITLSHLLRLATEQGFPVSREQALAFLNQEGCAFELWKQMMPNWFEGGEVDLSTSEHR